jgi:predicted RNA-binding Zn ribbon-like protein
MDLVVTGVDDDVLLLDLLNTTPVIDGAATDLLADPATATLWLAQHGLASQDRADLIAVRRVLQDVVRGDATPAALQPFLRRADLRPVATDDGVDWQLTGATAATRAALAWDGLRISSPGRLRPCANDECHLFLLDRSKPNTARWCSMAICGNRMKARRHYRRTRAD